MTLYTQFTRGCVLSGYPCTKKRGPFYGPPLSAQAARQGSSGQAGLGMNVADAGTGHDIFRLLGIIPQRFYAAGDVYL